MAVSSTVLLTGCVTRRMTIRSNPPGALVYVDDYEVGTTPCSHNFIYYGTREIRLVKDGYETMTVMQPMPAPWYEWPPLDFVSENLVPRKIHDDRTLTYNMQPQTVVPTEILLSRAEELRREAQPPVGVQPAPGSALAPQPGAPLLPLGPATAPLQPPPGQPGELPQPAPETLPPGGQPPIFAPPQQ